MKRIQTTPRRAALRRAQVTALVAAGVAALLSACGSSPPTHWYALRPDPPGAAATVPPADAGAAEVWELSPRVGLPGALDRDLLLLPRGRAGLEPLAGHRWAEPLRDSVPRLLLLDLARLRGTGRVWLAPAPAAAAAVWRLQVDVLVLQPEADARTLRLAARWWLQATSPATSTAGPPRSGSTDLRVPIDGPAVDDIAAAHRLALWRLAEAIAATGTPPAAAPTPTPARGP